MLVQAPTKHRFSVNDYYRMAETGLLRPDARVELLDGQIVDMSPIRPFHGGVVNYLTEFFVTTAKGRSDDYSEPEPDVMLLRRSPDYYRDRHPGPADVYLLVEVADSSLERDQGEKLPAYARAGWLKYGLWI
jgi:Uma2 family endonuclease